MDVAHRIRELEGKVAAVCMTCGVRRWLAEIKRLEVGER